MKKILCPVDFSANSLNAIEFAAKIAEKNQATLTLLHIFTEKEFGEALSRGLLADRYQSADIDNLVGTVEELLKNLAGEVNALSQEKGMVYCDYHFAYGTVEKNISHFAKDQQYTLIVMGTHGIRDVFEEYTGSHTIRTLERAHCPVLCIPEKVEYKPFKRIVYATDYQQQDDEVLRQLVAFADPFGAAVNVLHVYRHENEREEAVYHEYVAQVEPRFPPGSLLFSSMKFEDTAHGIDRFAIDQEAELVALYDKKKNFMEQLFSGSTIRSLAYFATYPVLFFREQASGQ